MVLTGERTVLTGVAQQISYDDVIDDFASKKARKVLDCTSHLLLMLMRVVNRMNNLLQSEH